jgi:hypothetical protein
LDALFQMTSKTFEELNGEAVSGKSTDTLASKIIRIF